MHKILETCIRFDGIEFLPYSSIEYKSMFINNGFDISSFPCDWECSSLWASSSSFVTAGGLSIKKYLYVDEIHISSTKTLTYDLRYSNLLKSSENDIRNNFLNEDGSIKDIDFVLAYGRGYQDSESFFTELNIDAFFDMVKNLEDLYSKLNY